MRTVLLATAVFMLSAAPVSAGSLDEAISGDHRSAENRGRDTYRHPGETLAFFGFRPDQTVVELWPGGGWYTEILAPALRDSGQLVLAVFGEGEPDSYRTRSHRQFVQKLESDPDVYGQVRTIPFWPPESVTLGPPGSADLVVTFRNVHSMFRRGQFEAFLTAAHDVLEPGGTLGIVQHRAEPGTDPETAKRSGYLPEQWVIEQAEAAGFKLAARSEINANPRDTKDHPDGVWSLPPGYQSGDKDREKFAAIGESDRMTLRFTRP